MSDAAWDAAHYAANTAHHRAFDEAFLSSTPFAPTDRVVDVGCGPGDFTHELARRLPGGSVVGVDPQRDFVDLARAGAAGNEEFVVGTAQTLSQVVEPASADGVVSRAALHWAPCGDQGIIAAEVRRVLRPGGWYRMDMGGAGNIAPVVSLLDDVSRSLGGPVSPWCFPTPDAAIDDLASAGLDHRRGHVRLVSQRRAFDRTTLVEWLTSQVLIAYEPGMGAATRARFRVGVVERLDDLRRGDGTWDQTFVRLDVLAFAP